jgi:hypothetical protein
MTHHRSKFVIEPRNLRSGVRYILREKRYSGLPAADSVHDLSVHSSMEEADRALSDLLAS